MKSILKISSLFILCASVLFCLTAYASDVKDELYFEAYSLVNSLNPVDEVLNGDEVLTRGEFTQAVVKIMNYGYVADVKLNFTDVEEGEKIYEPVCLAVNEGLIGNSSSFRPDDAITYTEAMTICVRALGYENLAKELGTWPHSYLNLSSQLELDDNLDWADSFSEKDAYILIYNMLNAKALSAQYVFSNENYAVNSNEQITLLESIYNIVCAEGVMNANSITAEGDEYDSGEPGRISVGDITLEGNGYDEYIGMNVKAYYKNDKKLNAVCVCPYDNDVIVLDAFSVDEVKRNGKAIEFISSDDKEYRSESAFEVIYNGKYSYSYTDSDFIPEAGYVTLVDNNSNGRYDVVKIDSFDYIYDARINKTDESIFDNTDSSKAVLSTDSDVSINIFHMSDAPATLSDISTGDALAVKKSKDGLYIEVYILATEIEGKVDAYNQTSRKIEIGGTEYNVSGSFSGKYSTDNLFKGYMTFVAGVNGEIIEVSEFTEKFRYGYLMKTRYDDFKSEGALLIFTDNGKAEEFPVGAKITIDGNNIDAKNIKNELSDYQLVRYMVNSEGVLLKIDTAEEGTEFVDMASRDDENSLTSYESFGTNFYYRANIQTFYPHFSVGNAVIFAIPDDVEAYDDYYIAQPIYFTYKKYNVTGYDISSNGKAGAVLYSYKNSDELSTAEKTDPVIVVEKAFKAINKDGEETTLLRGWDGKNFVEYYLDPKAKIDKASGINELYPGDVIRYSLRGDEMKALIVEFDAHPGTFGKNNVSGVSSFNQGPSGFQYQSGKVYSKADGYMYLANVMGDDGYDYSMKNLKLFNTTGATVLVIDCENGNSVRPGTVDDIMTYTESGEECDFVVLKQESVYTYHIIVYKGVEK